MQTDKFIVFWKNFANNYGRNNPLTDGEIVSHYYSGNLTLYGEFFVTDGPEMNAITEFFDFAELRSIDTSNIFYRAILLPKKEKPDV